MAQTITLLDHGTAVFRDARLRRPWSSRAAIYFISPAFPAAIQSGKYSSSPKSRTGAMPARSKPAWFAARFTKSEIWGMVDIRWDVRTRGQSRVIDD